MALIETEASSPRDEPVLQLRRAYFRSHDGSSPLGPLSFSVSAAPIHVLVGAPGSGKTAILEAIARANPPVRGGMALFGRDATDIPVGGRYVTRRRIGMIFRDLRLVEAFDAYQNVALAVRAAGGRLAERHAHIVETLAWLGLARAAGRAADGLTPEARLRLALARAVINRPDLLIVDMVDAARDDGFLALLQTLNQSGAAVLMAARDAAVAARVGGAVLALVPPAAARSDGDDRGGGQ